MVKSLDFPIAIDLFSGAYYNKKETKRNSAGEIKNGYLVRRLPLPAVLWIQQSEKERKIHGFCRRIREKAYHGGRSR